MCICVCVLCVCLCVCVCVCVCVCLCVCVCVCVCTGHAVRKWSFFKLHRFIGVPCVLKNVFVLNTNPASTNTIFLIDNVLQFCCINYRQDPASTQAYIFKMRFYFLFYFEKLHRLSWVLCVHMHTCGMHVHIHADGKL